MMKGKHIFAMLVVFGSVGGWMVHAEENDLSARANDTIILDETGVKNLRIQTEVVEERSFETTVFAIGRMEEVPENRSVVSSRISGRVVELNAFVGDEVKAGDVIAKVESRQPGSPPPVIPMTAQMGGLVVNSHVRLGEPVDPDEDLLDIVDRKRMWAVAKIPESEAHLIQTGSKAHLRVPALGPEIVTVTMLRFGVTADQEAGTVDGIFLVENPDGKLQPGMRAEFGIVVGSRANVLSVPRRAIQGDPTKRVVFVKDYELENAFVKAPVVLGEQNDEFVEVKQGLFPGDEVVTRGSYALTFAGSGGGMSLKEALDAAHGHEHNEDGSEKTPEQAGEHDHAEHGHNHDEHDHDHGEDEHEEHATSGSGGFPLQSPMGIALLAWAGVATVFALLWFQGLFRSRKKV